jgi:hypothetical protein
VAWVRRVRTASGATAVQIAESVDGRRRIVRHVGSARDEAELGLLIAEAQRLLADDAQGELDLGITPTVPRAVMVPAPARELLPAGRPAAPRWVRRPRVLRASSGLLYQALAGAYASLGFDAVGDDVFRDLVIARIVKPTSLLDTTGSWPRWAGHRRPTRPGSGPCAERMLASTAMSSRQPASTTPAPAVT